MTVERKPLSGWLKWFFKVPVWMYRAHLGFLFGGSIFAIVHHGRRSGKRYVSGLEVMTRRDGELFAFSSWGRRADWFRNIEAGGVDALWDGRRRYADVGFRVLEPAEAFEILATYERERPRAARQTLTRMLPGYDFSEAQRRVLADEGIIVGFMPHA